MIVIMTQYNINIHSYILLYKWLILSYKKIENIYK